LLANGRHQPIIGWSAGLEDFSPPVSTVSQMVKYNEVYLPQEAIDDLRRLVAAADKR
jgi:hypothetical protein